MINPFSRQFLGSGGLFGGNDPDETREVITSNARRLAQLLSDEHITESQHDQIKGLGPERARFELSLIQGVVAAGEIVSDEVFSHIHQQGDDYAFDIWKRRKSENERNLREVYASAVNDFNKKRKLLLDVKSQNIPHIRINPLDFAEGGDNEGMSISDYVCDIMLSLGYNPENLKVRMFDARRIVKALNTGTDRDIDSNLRHVDGVETELMKVFGVVGADNVTYVSDLHQWSGPSKFDEGLYDAIIVYHGNQLYKIGHENNGFSAFLGRPRQAVVAVFSEKGNPIMRQNILSANLESVNLQPQ